MAKVAPTYDEFIKQFPAFSEVPCTSVSAQIALSARLLSSSAWGKFYSDGVSLDAAHNLLLDSIMNSGMEGGQQGAAGPISSTSAAGISVSFESSSRQDSNASQLWYNKTGYGQKFLRLQRVVISPGVMSA